MAIQTQYTKDLTRIKSIRLSPSLLNQAVSCSDRLGISLSDFIRQSLDRNIHVFIERDFEDVDGNKQSACGD